MDNCLWYFFGGLTVTSHISLPYKKNFPLFLALFSLRCAFPHLYPLLQQSGGESLGDFFFVVPGYSSS